jgi:Putative esterase
LQRQVFSVRFTALIWALVFPMAAGARQPAATGSLRFEVRLGSGVRLNGAHGRLLVVLGTRASPEPRSTIGQTGMNAPPLLGTDLVDHGDDTVGVLDAKSEIFPIGGLAELRPGEYFAQAVFHANPDLNLVSAPGNLYSPAYKVRLDPVQGGTIPLTLSWQIAAEQMPADSQFVRYIKFPSTLLSQFHGRPMFLRVGVILPRDFDKDPTRQYPLRVNIGGYGTRFTIAGNLMSEPSSFRSLWLADNTPRMIMLVLDGAGPYGDPYQVNSDNNGPYGDVITQELIPFVEQRFRGVGKPHARFLDGASTGGWVSLALQVFYPAFFNGAWSQCPDPVDFRAYELINIYHHDNAYINQHGFERPSMRDVSGEVRFTLRHECQLENVLGRGNRWWLSGKDWCAWNAVFGPRGADGYPKPLWNGKTGAIDRGVVEHWKNYDLRLVLENKWQSLEPLLRGKIHIWVGDADSYYLNNAVHLLNDFLVRAQPPFEGRVVFAPRKGHTTGWSDSQIMQEMQQAYERGKR